MSYASQASSRPRTGTIAAVVAIHAVIGYGLVSGLGFEYIKHVEERFRSTVIPVPPETPPPPPPPSEAVEPAQPPIAAPVPPLDLTPPRPPIDVVVLDTIPSPVPMPVPRPSQGLEIPKPQPSFAPKAARPRNDPARWVMTEDYPAVSLRNEEEGTTGFAVIVGSDGKVDACEITKSSGSARLDEATCRYVEKRARFDAATDGDGARVVGRYTSTVRWQIPR